MNHFLSLSIVVFLALSGSAQAAKPVLGSWEAARGADDERIYLVLKKLGEAEIVAEYDFTLPGQPGKRRGRSTTFGKWVNKGGEIVVTYANIRDRLRYSDKVSLEEIGLSGSSPALKSVGKVDLKSKLRGRTLWRAPHEYRLKPVEQAPDGTTSTAAPGATPAAK